MFTKYGSFDPKQENFPLREEAKPSFTEKIGQGQLRGDSESGRNNQAAEFGGESLGVSFSFRSPRGNRRGHCDRRFFGLPRDLRGQRPDRLPAEAQSAPHAAKTDSGTSAAE